MGTGCGGNGPTWIALRHSTAILPSIGSGTSVALYTGTARQDTPPRTGSTFGSGRGACRWNARVTGSYGSRCGTGLQDGVGVGTSLEVCPAAASVLVSSTRTASSSGSRCSSTPLRMEQRIERTTPRRCAEETERQEAHQGDARRCEDDDRRKGEQHEHDRGHAARRPPARTPAHERVSPERASTDRLLLETPVKRRHAINFDARDEIP